MVVQATRKRAPRHCHPHSEPAQVTDQVTENAEIAAHDKGIRRAAWHIFMAFVYVSDFFSQKAKQIVPKLPNALVLLRPVENPRHSPRTGSGTCAGSPLCGWFSDRVRSRKWSMFAGALVSLAIMLIIMFTPQPGAGMLFALFFLLGVITAAQSIGYPVIAESNEDKVLGTANGFSAVLIMGMAAIAQPLFGWLIDVLGGETPENYRQAIWLMPASFLIALACTLRLRETFKR